MSAWPRLSMAIWPQDFAKGGPGRQIGVCMQCGRAGDDVAAWQECDDADKGEPIAICLCRRCSDEIIEPHPRLYKRVPAGMPFPGVMPCCVGCKHQVNLRCRIAKCHGGPGVHLQYEHPTVAFVDGRDAKTGRRTGWQQMVYHGPVACRDFAQAQEGELFRGQEKATQPDDPHDGRDLEDDGRTIDGDA